MEKNMVFSKSGDITRYLNMKVSIKKMKKLMSGFIIMIMEENNIKVIMKMIKELIGGSSLMWILEKNLVN